VNDQRPFRVLLLDDEEADLDQVANYLENLPRLQKWVQKPVRKLLAQPDAASVLSQVPDVYGQIDIILADLYMPEPEAGGLWILKDLAEFRKSRGSGPHLVIISAKLDAERRVEDYRREYRDWFRFLLKPAPLAEQPKQYHSEEVWAVGLEYAIYDMWRASRSDSDEEDELARAPLGKLAQEVLPNLDRLAKTDCPVLLIGERGVGKGLLARRMHARSARALKPVCAVSCQDVSETLLDSVLFGHAKGALLGTTQSQPGLCEKASEGTVVLRGLTELPLSQQGKLLSVIEGHTLARLGSVEQRPTNVRIICTATPDIDGARERGGFCPGLYDSFLVGRALIPALHERPEDIPVLAEHFLRLARERGLCSAEGFDAEASSRLVAYPWPGNVPEIRAAVFWAALASQGRLIAAQDLAPQLLADTGVLLEGFARERAKRFRELTDRAIWRALQACAGVNGVSSKPRTARMLGVPLSAFVAELERRNIDVQGGPQPRHKFYGGVPAAPRPPAEQVTVEFGMDTVTVDGRRWRRDEAWRILEYFVCKNDWVHWTEGYLIFPGWLKENVRDRRELFRRKITSSTSSLASQCRLNLNFDRRPQRAVREWRLVGPSIVSNIAQANEQYQKAEEEFSKGKELDAASGPLLKSQPFAQAKEEVLKALEIYPAHLKSQVLLAKCYEKLAAKDALTDEVENFIRPSWEYLEEMQVVFENLRQLTSKTQDRHLQTLLARVMREGVLSQAGKSAQTLWELVSESITARDPVLAEVLTQLKAIANAQDDSARGPLIDDFLRLQPVRDILPPGQDGWLGSSLFYTKSGKVDLSRIRRLLRMPFKGIEEFQAYFRAAILRMRKGLDKSESPEAC